MELMKAEAMQRMQQKQAAAASVPEGATPRMAKLGPVGNTRRPKKTRRHQHSIKLQLSKELVANTGINMHLRVQIMSVQLVPPPEHDMTISLQIKEHKLGTPTLQDT